MIPQKTLSFSLTLLSFLPFSNFKFTNNIVLPSSPNLLMAEETPAELINDLNEATEIFKEEANQAKQSEAKQSLSFMSRVQQAFYVENSFFASRIEDLGLGLQLETENYSYSIIEIDKKQLVQMVALSKKDELRTYTAIVGLQGTSGNYSSIWILCESDQPTREFPPKQEDANSCPPGYSEVEK